MSSIDVIFNRMNHEVRRGQRDVAKGKHLSLLHGPVGRRDWIGLTTLLAMSGALVAGCGDNSSEPAATTSPEQISRNVSQGAPTAPAQVQPQKLDLQAGADTQTVLAELNRQLKRWIVSNQRAPASFEEFVGSAQIQLPTPPPGKKYVLTKQMRIELVNQ